MKISSLIGHVKELFSALEKWEKPADSVINEFYRARKYLGSRDRKFISNQIYGLIRNFRLYQEIASNVFQSSDDLIEQMIFVNHVVNGSEDTLLTGLFTHSFDNYDALASAVKEQNELLSKDIYIKYSFPEWMKHKIEKVLPENEVDPFLNALSETAPTTIRITNTKNFDSVVKEFEQKGASLSKNRFAPHSYSISKRIVFTEMKTFLSGDFEVQDEGSQLVTLLSGSESCLNVLDACAGGGGKTLYLSKLINKNGLVYAYDADQKRLDMLGKRLKGKRYGNIRFLRSLPALDKFLNTFDLVVIDAPCSGSGTIRRNPDLKWRLKENDIAKYAEKQLEILRYYSKFAKKDGIIEYITCSLFQEENEEVIERFLSSEGGFSLEENPVFFKNYSIEPSGKFLRLYPHKQETDAFTACCLKKNF